MDEVNDKFVQVHNLLSQYGGRVRMLEPYHITEWQKNLIDNDTKKLTYNPNMEEKRGVKREFNN